MFAGVTLHNFLLIGVMASLFIVALKAVAIKTGPDGLRRFAGAI